MITGLGHTLRAHSDAGMVLEIWEGGGGECVCGCGERRMGELDTLST